MEGRVKAAAFLARVREMEEGEKPSAYFFQALRARRNASSISGLRGGDGLVLEIKPMLAVAESFYSELFSARRCDPGAQEVCLKAITARLGVNEAGSLESPLSLEEMGVALGKMRDGRAAGHDGLPKEFFVTFWDLLGPDLLEVCSVVLERGVLPPSMRKGVVVLLFKHGPACVPRPVTTPEVGLSTALVGAEFEASAPALVPAPVPVPGSARVRSPALRLRGSAEAIPGISTGSGFVQVFGPGAAPPAVSGPSLAGDAGGGAASGPEDGLAADAESVLLQSLELLPRLEGGGVSGGLEGAADGVAPPTSTDLKSPAAWGDSMDFEGGPVAEWAKLPARKRAASAVSVSPKGPKTAAVEIPLANRFEVLAGNLGQEFPDFEMDLDPSPDLLGWDAEQLEAVMGLPPEKPGGLGDGGEK
ncbi:hypothetical protein SKAU_G00138360 [Synaphobranchus kaupii]|uniref:Uncharacterized protein n=1 Tax=Synaphobranchus kaupii TaxID=118154 RepID=A0A9Q1FRR5_SYNKA|nr:hypothetical protein SKAU_G00138360 [Synaphobranchus kaupii]